MAPSVPVPFCPFLFLVGRNEDLSPSWCSFQVPSPGCQGPLGSCFRCPCSFYSPLLAVVHWLIWRSKHNARYFRSLSGPFAWFLLIDVFAAWTQIGFWLLQFSTRTSCAFPAAALALPSGSWRLCHVPEFSKWWAFAAKFQGLWKPRQLREQEQEGVNCASCPSFLLSKCVIFSSWPGEGRLAEPV